MRRPATLALSAGLGICLHAATPVAAQDVGSWRLACATDRMTDQSACTLLHREPVERSLPGRPALALEVLERGGRLLPAVTARDLTIEGAARGLLALTGTAQLRFPPQRLFDMPCGLEGRSLVCLPREADQPRAAEELPAASRVLVRMQGIAGAAGGEPTELRLDGTAAALARYRATVPVGTAAPPEPPGLELRDLLQRLQRLFG